jgi:recombinational DNA repair protein (RecF pathway)
MAYQTYITEALVCGSNDRNTADRSFLLFTRDAGMVYAGAKSVREERSKQRYALQECSHVRVTLVRGKSGWKIAGAEPIQNFYALTETRETRGFLRDVIVLLRRVLHGETAHEEIFDDVIAACTRSHTYDKKKLETVLSLRILHRLGYVAPKGTYETFLHSALSYAKIDDLGEREEKECREAIDHALMQSQL